MENEQPKYYSESRARASIKYIKDKQKRVPLQYKIEEFDTEVKPAIDQSGLPVGTYIKRAIADRIEVDKILREHNIFMCVDEVSAFILDAVRDKIERQDS